MSEFIKHTVKQRRGIDDIGILGDFAREWWTEEDYAKEAREAPEKQRERDEYIAKLKTEGRYGEEYELEIYYKPNPLFDDITSKPDFKESYRFDILDITNTNTHES